MKTKRRKAWVVLGEDGNVVSASDSRTDARAKSRDAQADGWNWTAHAFIERRRGDVVLSREQVEVKATEIAQDLVAEGFDVEDAPTFIRCVVRALLRGGRR